MLGPVEEANRGLAQQGSESDKDRDVDHDRGGETRGERQARHLADAGNLGGGDAKPRDQPADENGRGPAASQQFGRPEQRGPEPEGASIARSSLITRWIEKAVRP